MPNRPPTRPTPSAPITEFPSPVLDDLIFTERYDHKLASFGPDLLYQAVPEYGTEHPTRAGFRLVFVRLTSPEAEQWYDWVYVNDRSNQDTYNYELSYPAGDPDFPLVQRTYLIRRSEYVPLAEGAEDPGVDAAGDPQFPGALLTRQRLVRLEDPQLDSLYVLVQRWYEIVPGKVMHVGDNLDGADAIQKYRIIISRYQQRVSIETLLPVLPIVGSEVTVSLGVALTALKLEWEAVNWSVDQAYVLSARILPLEDSDTYGTFEFEVGCKPPVRYEYPSVGFTFPGVFDILAPWFEAGAADGYTTPMPWAGVHYSTIAPKSMNPTARVSYSYFIEGEQDPSPEKFRVVSPAAASRFWRDLPHNTIHPEVTITEYIAVGLSFVGTTVEYFPASTPATYEDTDVLLISSEDETWRGLIKERRTVRVSEATDPYDFA